MHVDSAQMTSLLPEAKHAIDMLADWIVESFERHTEKTKSTDAPSNEAPPLKIVAPSPLIGTSSLPSARAPAVTTPNIARDKLTQPGFTSESDRDDENTMLSFTPKRRRASNTGSRAESPAPNGSLAASSQVFSSSDEAGSSNLSGSTAVSLPHTPDSSPQGKTENRPSISQQLLMPHERAARDKAPRPPSANSTLSARQQDSFTASKARRLFVDTSHDSVLAVGSSSDEDSRAAGRIEPSLEAAATLSPPRVSASARKTSRSGSGNGGSGTGTPANLIDAKDLLRRRREDAVYGISTATSSAVQSDDDDDVARVSRATKGKK